MFTAKIFKCTFLGLGKLVEELDIKKFNVPVFEKTLMSMCVDPMMEHLQKYPNHKNVFLCGIETHACIFQTTLDLLNSGYNVHLIADACSSRSPTDR